MRAVLVDCQSLTVAGERTGTDRWTRGFLFNAVLGIIAVRLGLATAALHGEDEAHRRRVAAAR
jgi:hypothetical protein